MNPYYEEDGVTIYHGDCRDVLPTLSGIGLIVTSPPYNLGTSLDDTPNEASHDRRGDKQRLTGGYADHEDNLSLAEYKSWQREVLSASWTALSDDGAIFYNHKPRVQRGKCLLPTEFIPPEVLLRQVIIWDRVTKGLAMVPQAYNTGHEWLLLLAKPGFRLRDRGASAASDIWRFPPESNDYGHPCPMPLGIPLLAIGTSSFTGPVLDPFMGSGTTLRAAKDLGRSAIGIEKSERYCEIAARRLSQGVLDFGGAP